VTFAAAATLLAGCAEWRKGALPTVPMPASWTSGTSSTASLDASTQSQWWRGFNDPLLEQLIDDALRTNNDLAAAAIRVYRAQLLAGLADTNRLPNVALGASGSVTRALDAHRSTHLSGLSGSMSYEVDLWGKLAAQRDLARWQAEATQADLEAAQQSLIGTTAVLYWQIAYLNQQIALSDANIAYAVQTLDLVRSRYRAGAASALDVAQAEQGLALQRVEQTKLMQNRAESRNALAILFDRPPQQPAAERASLSNATLPGVDAGLPADLLGRRPDLRAAEFRLRESLAHVDVTRTSFYPSFKLTGELGTSSASLERWLQNPVATLGAGLALPLIQWNTMQLEIKVSRTQFEEAVVNFRQQLYVALSEVENALSGGEQLEQEAEQCALLLEKAQRAETLAKARFTAGATGVQPWLDQQQRLRDAQGAQAQNLLSQLINRVNLYRALGGDA
jgi:NodT family efflux transporter outer membrane factor (OMF) lipoprotein